MDQQVKISFALERDPDDWPPFQVETLWADLAPSDGHYVIDSAPFFSRAATIGDVVEATAEGADLRFVRLIRTSGHSLIRVIVRELASLETLAKWVREMGCYTEGFANFKLLAIDVPLDVKLCEVQRFLREENERGTLDYEEAILRQDE